MMDTPVAGLKVVVLYEQDAGQSGKWQSFIFVNNKYEKGVASPRLVQQIMLAFEGV